jgi:hypothetical protein
MFLVGSAFDKLSKAEDVRATAEVALIRMFAVASLIVPNLRRPTIDHLFRDRDDGGGDTFVFVTGVEARAKVGVVSVLVNGVANESSGPTEAQSMLQAAIGHPHLESVLDMWGNGSLTWPRLYRIVEELELQLGKDVDDAGFCTKAERVRFMRTANTAEASGLDARHAVGQFQPLSDPMASGEAKTFVRALLVKVFAQS